MKKLTSLFHFVLKTTFKAVSRVVLMVTFGIILNVVLLFFLPDICDLSRGEVPFNEYLQHLASNCTLALVITLLFLVGFPLAYLVLAQKFGVQTAIHYAYVQNKGSFYEYFTDKMVGYIGKRQQKDASAGLMEIAGRFLQKLNGVPWLFRVIIGFFKDKIPFLEIIEKIGTEVDISPDANVQEVAEKLAEEADEYVEDELLKPNLWLFWVVLAINAGVFGVVKLVFGQ